ncbi:DUF86 domain-containing protein [Carboxydocella sp. JDF658]|uniref:type VII toxin-antitoxin system HepT family RNase toxin n=1 Tax=Carboxydocella sp. JDF658 TaxID=1926600 RepID=UPI0009D42F03|nr:DUF86 domain-containing protein [Carboxydocella sp. JDF658]GAW30197.1 hypothetical protein ULO1_27670 [Carboxydocella sp. ULO1]
MVKVVYNSTRLFAYLENLKERYFNLAEMAKLSKEEFLADKRNSDIVFANLYIALNIILDAGSHIIVKNGQKRPGTYREIIDELGKLGVIPADFAERVKGLAGYRNRMAHGYIDITPEELYQIITENLDDIKKFIGYFSRLLT